MNTWIDPENEPPKIYGIDIHVYGGKLKLKDLLGETRQKIDFAKVQGLSTKKLEEKEQRIVKAFRDELGMSPKEIEAIRFPNIW